MYASLIDNTNTAYNTDEYRIALVMNGTTQSHIMTNVLRTYYYTEYKKRKIVTSE